MGGRFFEEKVSGKLRTDDRPGLTAALAYLHEGDMLTVQEVDRLGRNLLEGLIVLNDLFQRGVAVKVLQGIAAGEHVERSLILDLALALAEDRRRDIARKTKNGLDSARTHGRVAAARPSSTTTSAGRSSPGAPKVKAFGPSPAAQASASPSCTASSPKPKPRNQPAPKSLTRPYRHAAPASNPELTNTPELAARLGLGGMGAGDCRYGC